MRPSKKEQLKSFFLETMQHTGEHEFQLTYEIIAQGSGLSLGTVVKGLRDLEAEGFLAVQKAKSRRTPNIYVIRPNHHFLQQDPELMDSHLDSSITTNPRIEYLERTIASLTQMVAEYEQSECSIVSRQDIPNGYQVIVRQARPHSLLQEKWHREASFVERLLDRRTIGLRFDHLAHLSPEKTQEILDEEHQLSLRIKRRLERLPFPLTICLSLTRDVHDFSSYVLSLCTRHTLAHHIPDVVERYQELVTRLKEIPGDPEHEKG